MDEKEILRTLEVFKPGESLVEIRIIGQGKGDVYSGYFTDHDKIVEAVKPFFNTDKIIYFVFNNIDSVCYAKQQRDKIIKTTDATNASNIRFREWVMIDIDPDRRGNKVSSTEKEKESARIKGNQIKKYLCDLGFPHPVIADSGNGYHLFYKCCLANTDENTELIKKFLQYLAYKFSDKDLDITTEKSEVDVKVFDPNRITKLYGTYARKGSDTSDRPHRKSRIIRVPQKIVATDKSLFELVVSKLPVPEKKTYQNNYGKSRFDIDDFLKKFNIEVHSDIFLSDGTRKIVLEECPFNPAHKAPDSAIFISTDGRIGFTCFHNGCSDKRWQDVRQLFEPDAYEQRAYDPFRRSTLPPDSDLVIRKATDELGPKWLSTSDIKTIDRDSIISIPSGIKELDDAIVGFDLREVTLWSGSNASGKSSVLNFIQLNAVKAGFKVAIWSAELPPQQLKSWITLQAAGRQYNKPSNFANAYYTPKHIVDKIDKWLKDKLYVYNNDYGNKFEQLFADIEEKVISDNINVVVIDNIMGMNINSLDGDKYSKQTQAILEIVTLAKRLNIHIHIVAHPRKVTTFLRKVDISGSADLTNAVNNVLIIHRVNRDFERGIGEFYGQEVVSQYMQYGNVLEITKNRSFGIVDKLIGLYYEPESRRFLNTQFENPIYGWEEVYFEQNLELPNNSNTFDTESSFDGGYVNFDEATSESPF